MEKCIFCKIANGEIPSKKFYEDDRLVIIGDINPQAKMHYLMIPKTHFANIVEMAEKAPQELGECFKTLSGLIDTLGLNNGFRVISNCGEDGCQSVQHLHIHILGGEKLSEIMG